MNPGTNLGATCPGDSRCRFLVWAPLAEKVELHIVAPHERLITLDKHKNGYYGAFVEDVKPGSCYYFRLDGEKERPDPASRYQPEGVHGPSQVINNGFTWKDGCWFGQPLQNYVIYELHVGTFTQEGTFDAIIPVLLTR